jgi:hypothetical protein
MFRDEIMGQDKMQAAMTDQIQLWSDILLTVGKYIFSVSYSSATKNNSRLQKYTS